MDVNERIGGADITRADIMPRVRVTQDCNLYDLKGTGSFYTWNNKYKHGGKVYNRIDRAFINGAWLNEYPDSVANFLPEGLFYHCPCLINFEVQMTRRPTAFKYYNMWALAKNFEELMMKDPLNEELCQAERACTTKHGELLKAMNMYLRQKAKMAWVNEGDWNTTYFHSTIRRRRSQNRVYRVKDMHQQVCDSSDDIKFAFEEFYKTLLGESKEVAHVNKRIVRRGKCLTVEHIDRLLAPISDLEIKAAVFDIPGNNAPGHDGYSSQFFKDACYIVRGDVCGAIRDVYTKGKLLK
ncbi:uncharacterized protein LOC141634440 [Silene latifolia]|uniref:uncharacterized protein LOC141634440 n=1 Tax=Silene latifolia TaxID=37657 RepID=UPI003D78655C